jgi:hypothetical protein
MSAAKTCSIDGCERVAKTRGWCGPSIRILSGAVAIPSLAVDLGPWTRRRKPDPLVGEEVGTRTITPARRRRMIPAAAPPVTDDPATSPTIDRLETGGRSPK